MPRFRPRPVVVEAWQFQGEPTEALERWLGAAFETWLPSKRQLAFQTGAGEQIASAGDWIVQGVGGTLSVCASAHFAAADQPVGKG
jgi:hypothetical protein